MNAVVTPEIYDALNKNARLWITITCYIQLAKPHPQLPFKENYPARREDELAGIKRYRVLRCRNKAEQMQ